MIFKVFLGLKNFTSRSAKPHHEFYLPLIALCAQMVLHPAQLPLSFMLIVAFDVKSFEYVKENVF